MRRLRPRLHPRHRHAGCRRPPPPPSPPPPKSVVLDEDDFGTALDGKAALATASVCALVLLALVM